MYTLVTVTSYQAELFYFHLAVIFKVKADWFLSVDVYQEFL